MNYMKQVAQMLGLEWDDEKGESEVFVLDAKGKNVECIITYDGLSEASKRWEISYLWLNDALSGKVTITKKYWRPKNGEKYFMPDLIFGLQKYFTYSFWKDEYLDNLRYENNLVFRTKEEAIAEAERILQLRKEADK